MFTYLVLDIDPTPTLKSPTLNLGIVDRSCPAIGLLQLYSPVSSPVLGEKHLISA